MSDVTPKRVAILGFAPTYADAPFDDPSVEIWGLNDLHRFLPRWTRWFELHSPAVCLAAGEAYHAWLTQPQPGPVYMQERSDAYPSSVAYPFAAVTAQLFPGRPQGYFTCSVTYMLALAIVEGFTEIGIYGVDLSGDTEYVLERPAAEYLIGLAIGLGRSITIAEGSSLLTAPVRYGYDDRVGEDLRDPIHSAYLAAHLEELRTKRAAALAAFHEVDGAVKMTEYYLDRRTMAARGVDWRRADALHRAAQRKGACQPPALTR